MSMLFGGPKLPDPPPPPPNPANLAAPSIMEQGAAERKTLAGAQGAGSDGTNVTGGQGASAPSTTKSLLGG
jgi:hypothetical protein